MKLEVKHIKHWITIYGEDGKQLENPIHANVNNLLFLYYQWETFLFKEFLDSSYSYKLASILENVSSIVKPLTENITGVYDLPLKLLDDTHEGLVKALYGSYDFEMFEKENHIEYTLNFNRQNQIRYKEAKIKIVGEVDKESNMLLRVTLSTSDDQIKTIDLSDYAKLDNTEEI